MVEQCANHIYRTMERHDDGSEKWHGTHTWYRNVSTLRDFALILARMRLRGGGGLYVCVYSSQASIILTGGHSAQGITERG